MRAAARARGSFTGTGSLLRGHAPLSGAPLVSRCLSQVSAPVLSTTQTAWATSSSSASGRLAGLRRLMATPVILHAGRSTLLAAGITVKATTDHPSTAYALDQRHQQGLVAQKVEDKVDEAQRALADAKRKEAEARPPEWYVILMGFTGALVGYATAMTLKFVGRYVFYFAAAETTALLVLTATGAITRGTALEVAKYTMPPFAWALKTVISAARGQFQQIFSASSLALRFFFVLSFGLTLKYSRAGPKQTYRA